MEFGRGQFTMIAIQAMNDRNGSHRYTSWELKMKSYIVTGGARGIGKAIASELLKLGQVAILDVDTALGVRTAKTLGRRVHFVPCDLADPAQIAAAARSLRGFKRVDGLVNNAGIGASGSLETLSVEAWDRVLNVNLRAAWLCVKAFLPKMKADAAVVNIASTRALMSEPDTEAYAASKGGLLALTHAMALSLQKRQIRVNAVLPGWIDVSGGKTKLSKRDHAQHPAGRVGKPADIAQAAAFLLDGQRSGFITGQRLVVDGGMTVKMIYE
jgi:NAD(P)-dependent dehydrogenase (short-subunit alcohol dehydrogenase family)